MRAGDPIAPHPFVGCRGLQSFPVMRDAWDAVQNDPRFDGCVPFRCRTCNWWHVSRAGRAVEQGRESTSNLRACEPARGPAEPLGKQAA